ncbi:regulator of G-protein signaling 2 isoform X2 [Kryptolebias marmoratus]|uniref:regulator of G-protein signaling 2 isoform X2 n=1 Tax=Kryptolebias marmoratus TaxID=37003 RepID=UPI0007F8CBA8|nr:regulator of G-protein signaling 2 isoform X2 [Kryptolebias marmoratus]
MDLKGTKQVLDTDETSLLEESLETVLSKKRGQRAFRDFLKSEFCEENLDFWLACQEFQTFDHPEEQTQIAASIYEEFVSEDSPKQSHCRGTKQPQVGGPLTQCVSHCCRTSGFPLNSPRVHTPKLLLTSTESELRVFFSNQKV